MYEKSQATEEGKAHEGSEILARALGIFTSLCDFDDPKAQRSQSKSVDIDPRCMRRLSKASLISGSVRYTSSC